MHDRYLFRGQQPNGKWVRGHLDSRSHCSGIEVVYIRGVGVHPPTVGQCTGLKDKNGGLIFEGDIVHIADWECNAEAYWEGGAWMLYFGAGSSSGEYLYDSTEMCEIIGNIHDNPELMNAEA